MDKKIKKEKPLYPGVVPQTEQPAEDIPLVDPKQQQAMEEDPDRIPDEEEEESPPYESPPSGEGP
jgi:hypothetical protein